MKKIASADSGVDPSFFIEKIHTDGIVIIKGGVSSSVVAQILEFIKNFKYTLDEEIEIKKRGMRLNNYGDNIFNVITKRPEFLSFYTEGLIGKILKVCLNDSFYRSIPPEYPNYILRNVLARSSGDAMPFHIDSLIPYVGNCISVMQISIFLEKSDASRGCTKVVLGSHQSGEFAPQSGVESINVEAEAGDVAIWDSRLWHATTTNTTSDTRWALIGTFCRWYLKQGYDYPRAIDSKIIQNMSVANRIVLGCASRVPLNELEKTEVKGGIEFVLNPNESA